MPCADLCLSRFACSCLASATAAALCGLALLAVDSDDMRFLAGEVLASPALWVRGWGGEARLPSGWAGSRVGGAGRSIIEENRFALVSTDFLAGLDESTGMAEVETACRSVGGPEACDCEYACWLFAAALASEAAVGRVRLEVE